LVTRDLATCGRHREGERHKERPRLELVDCS